MAPVVSVVSGGGGRSGDGRGVGVFSLSVICAGGQNQNGGQGESGDGDGALHGGSLSEVVYGGVDEGLKVSGRGLQSS